uniref:Uncharacterized protein n=1 Tax=Kwoniella pini CBS 10737 TaxID=1296096 RepID=A0A1B9I5F7_9TREE|nr:uncharacterized protein I206_02811 [Kwoniella pini CBS 10737]OCF50755.1 hypothetical protein I206_02811 [Kwoniella pini CBS 10737]
MEIPDVRSPDPCLSTNATLPEPMELVPLVELLPAPAQIAPADFLSVQIPPSNEVEGNDNGYSRVFAHCNSIFANFFLIL